VASRSRLPLAAALACAAALVHAGDRPYLATHSAAAEEDDDAVWSVESWFARWGRSREWVVAPEYAFDPTTSLQFEFMSRRDRSAGTRGQGAEIEFKHLFNHIARDGYGWGVVLSQQFERESAASWRGSSYSVKLPATLALGEGMATVHLNVGLEKPRGVRRENLASVALEGEVLKRITLFAEAARDAEGRLVHAGMRWWAQRERLAIDVAAQRTRGDGERHTGFVIGIGFYDL
jgi:hypothetical protein